ncbi:AEC family transporter [Rhodocytophaga rosea]|uniref:AEC family transporter n=1 Tax=Rhodocytophaga rosea TaxID=2704465 RepID=A0A6C0GDN5_9BACT|nr:AEC family transporter [Rhodocytophaga rosea]QHT66119.1 AEC family transporter [Rhodocytophaga rosea]
MSNINDAFLTSLLIIAAGYILKKLKVVSENDGKVVSKIVIYLTFPALILHTVSSLQITSALIFLPLVPLAFSMVLLLLFSWLLKNKVDALKGVVFMSVCGFNIGLFAYPIIEGIWGKEGLQHLAMFDVGNAISILCISYILGFIYSPSRERHKPVDAATIFKMLITSVPLVSYTLALVLNVSGFQMPGLMEKFIGTLARANMSLVLILLGIYLNIRVKKHVRRPLIYIMAARYSIGLLLGLVLYYLLPFEPIYKTIALVGLIMPVGLTVIPFADEFGYDQALPVSLASITIVFSFILMWILILTLQLA